MALPAAPPRQTTAGLPHLRARRGGHGDEARAAVRVQGQTRGGGKRPPRLNCHAHFLLGGGARGDAGTPTPPPPRPTHPLIPHPTPQPAPHTHPHLTHSPHKPPPHLTPRTLTPHTHAKLCLPGKTARGRPDGTVDGVVVCFSATGWQTWQTIAEIIHVLGGIVAVRRAAMRLHPKFPAWLLLDCHVTPRWRQRPGSR